MLCLSVCLSVSCSQPPGKHVVIAVPCHNRPCFGCCHGFPASWGQCLFAVACPLPSGDHVLIGAGATFGCAVLEQEQLLERVPREKAWRERKQQGTAVFSVRDPGIGRTLLLRSWLQAALSMFDMDYGVLQLPLTPSSPHCALRSISQSAACRSFFHLLSQDVSPARHVFVLRLH